MDACPTADYADQRLPVSALLFAAELDGLDGIGRIDGEMSLLVSLNQRRQHLQSIAGPGSLVRAQARFRYRTYVSQAESSRRERT